MDSQNLPFATLKRRESWVVSVSLWSRLTPPTPFLVYSIVREIMSIRVRLYRIQRLEHRHDCHLAQISLRKGAGEHVLQCDGSLKKGLPFSNIEEESLKHEPCI